MEVISANDGLLTNIEVKELLEYRRNERKMKDTHQSMAADLQNRERIEMQVRFAYIHHPSYM
jgi:hypothetical protein